MRTAPSKWYVRRWFLPSCCALTGLGIALAHWIGGHPGDGLKSLALMSVVGGALALGGRSETIRMIRGDGRDERWAQIDLTASALAGLVLVTVLVGCCIYEWAQGRSGEPFTQLAAIGGLSYLAALVWLRWRG